MVDDVHELGPAEAGRQLELLVMRGPLELRLVLATRQDVRLGRRPQPLAPALTRSR